MFIIYGAYHFWPKRIAFRNDYCLSCAAPRRSIQIRTFDVGSLYWVPVLPVGFWKHWKCSVCNRDPHAHRRATRFGKSFWALVLLALSAAWISIAREAKNWTSGMMIAGIGAGIGAVFLVVHLLAAQQPTPLKDHLAAIQPATDTVCPFCGTQLLLGPQCSCPICGIVRL